MGDPTASGVQLASTVVQGIAATVLVVITGIYVRLTRRLARAAERQVSQAAREAEERLVLHALHFEHLKGLLLRWPESHSEFQSVDLTELPRQMVGYLNAIEDGMRLPAALAQIKDSGPYRKAGEKERVQPDRAACLAIIERIQAEMAKQFAKARQERSKTAMNVDEGLRRIGWFLALVCAPVGGAALGLGICARYAPGIVLSGLVGLGGAAAAFAGVWGLLRGIRWVARGFRGTSAQLPPPKSDPPASATGPLE